MWENDYSYGSANQYVSVGSNGDIWYTYPKVSVDELIYFYNLDREFVMSQKHPLDVAKMLGEMKVKYAGHARFEPEVKYKYKYERFSTQYLGEWLSE